MLGVSLNNQLHQGPELTNSLLCVLLRFRQGPVALVADIEGMFNQVKVPPEDADALRFLWWKDSNLERPSEFQMTSYIFGAIDSPSCAIFCLKRAAEDNKGNFSEDAVNAVNEDLYVDDFIKSVKTVEEARSLANEVTSLLAEAGFRLTKWMSNSRDVLSVIPEEEWGRPKVDFQLKLKTSQLKLKNIRSSVGRGKGRLPIHGSRAKPATNKAWNSVSSKLSV